MRRRTVFRPTSLAVVLALLGGCGPEASRAPARFAKLPYLQAPGRTEITIRWTTTAPRRCAVRYGSGDALGAGVSVAPFGKAGGEFPGSPEEHLYRARLTGLAPGTTYRYVVACGEAASEATFRTAPDGPEAFSFIAYGDSRTYPDAHAAVAGCFPEHSPAFVLHTGDMVGFGAYGEWQEQFFAPLAEAMRRVPLWPVRGNHEGKGASFRQLLELPGGKTYYSFDYANAHFVCLDSMAFRDAEMLEWCAKDLAASKAAWTFVSYHDPSYDAGRHRSRWGRGNLLPILRKAGVDFVLTGHSHSYQRFRPMFTKGENESRPITHIVTAGGGAPLYDVGEHPHLAVGLSAYHYVVFRIDGDRLSLRALTPDGTEIDALSVTKTGGRFDKAYLSLAVSEDTFDKGGDHE